MDLGTSESSIIARLCFFTQNAFVSLILYLFYQHVKRKGCIKVNSSQGYGSET